MAAGSPSRDVPLSGLLEFLDPRPAASAVAAPGDPYGNPFRIRPQAGMLVIFLSWLEHWVHPYAGQTPRVAVSFNAAMTELGEVPLGPDIQTGAGRMAAETSVACTTPSQR